MKPSKEQLKEYATLAKAGNRNKNDCISNNKNKPRKEVA